ncbi:MAG: hypothetical protein J6S67_02105 [Methanobrevibacter sp.]|nr:hypothetical protein [Methanobrevibacter sp.]
MNLRRCYAGDFETTTDENDARVWAYSLCNVDDPSEFIYGNSIDEFFDFCADYTHNYKIWFHNLKFDGVWLISWLLNNGYTWISDKKERADNTFTTLIGNMGQFYSITVYFKINKHHTNKVEFYDSLKLFPNFSVEKIAKAFNLPIQKLKIDYHQYRPVGWQLTDEEIAYIRNDVEIVARALKEMFKRGLTKMTIASNAVNNFKEHFYGFRRRYPVLPLEVDKDIRKSYRGGFTYVNDTWKERPVGKGIVLDVNSLYPSCMSSPYFLPFGQPVLFNGKYEEDAIYPLYIQSFTCSFDLKPNKIPSVQIRNSLSFIPNEYVKTTDGERVTLYLTKPDFELFCEQYDYHNIVYNGGWKFMMATGDFDKYIQYWTEQKIKAGKEGNAPLRSISKLMLNSLYGKFGSSGEARQKIPYLDDGVVNFALSEKEERETVYVAAASFITSYGRNRTIRTSQIIKDYTMKKYGEDRYYYSDTDSIHCSLTDEDLEELKDIIKIDDYKLGYWAKEAEFERAYYIRQKCYIEEINGKVEVTVAGLPSYLAPLITFDNFKRGFTTEGMSHDDIIRMAIKNGANPDEIEHIHHKLTYKYVKGGVILADTDFTIK